MKKKIVLLSIFILILLSGCFFQLPERISLKTNPTYNFNIGSLSYSFSEKLDIDNLFNSIGESDPRIKIYDYNPDEKSEYQQFLIKMPIQDIQLDFGDFINEIGLSDAVKDISFNKTIKIPEINFSNKDSFDISGLKNVVGNFITVESHTTSDEISDIPFVGKGEFSEITYSSGTLTIEITNGSTNSVKLIGNGLDYKCECNGNYFTLDLKGKTIKSDMQIQIDSESAITYRMYAINTVVSKASGIKYTQAFSKEIDLDLGFESLGVKSCTIADGFVSAKTNVPSGWEGVTIAKSIELTGAIEKNFDDELNLQDVSLEDDEIGMNAIATLILNNATIDFSKNLDLDVQFKVNSFSEVSMELDTNQDSLSISESYDLPKEMSKYIKTISLSKSQITGTYTNTLPEGNDISISATSNFLGLNGTETLAANNKSKEIKIGNDSNEKTITINDGSAIDFEVNVLLPGATQEKPNLLCVKNVTSGTTYELGMNLSFDLDWTKVELKDITAESSKGAVSTNFSLSSMFTEFDDFLKTDLASDIKIKCLPLYLYVEKPEITSFKNLEINGSIKIGNGKVNGDTVEFSGNTELINELKTSYFPNLKFKDDGKTVINDISKENNSGCISLEDIVNESNSDNSLCFEYDISLEMNNADVVTVTKDELEKANGKTSIAVTLAIAVPFDFILEDAKEIDLLDVTGLKVSEGEDFFGRESATNLDEVEDILKNIHSTFLNYNILKFPFYSEPGIKIVVKFSDDDIVEFSGNDGSINIDLQNLLTQYPLQPEVLVQIPKSNFYISRDKAVEMNIGILINAAVEIDLFGGK